MSSLLSMHKQRECHVLFIWYLIFIERHNCIFTMPKSFFMSCCEHILKKLSYTNWSYKIQTPNELRHKLVHYIQRDWLIFCHFYGKQTIWIHTHEDTEYCLISRDLKNNNMSPRYFFLFTIHWCAKLSRHVPLL